jgi:hypothetical protein
MTLEILWADGFDNYAGFSDMSTLYAVAPNYGGVTTFGAGRTNGKSVEFPFSASGLVYSNLQPQTDITAAFASFPIANAGSGIFEFQDISSGATLLLVDLSSPNLAKITANGNLVQYNIPILPAGDWTHIQIRLNVGISGSYSITTNGANTIVSASGVNTTANSGAITSCNRFSAILGSAQIYMDDLLICTGGLPGDCRLQTDFPISNAAVQFTPLANQNWQEVSETAMDGDTSYNSSSTVGNVDLFNFTPLSIPAGSTILGCFLRAAASKTDAGTRSFQTKMTSGSNSALGASTALSTSYEYKQDDFTTFLSGLGLLSEAGINGTTAGYALSA